MPSSQRFPEGGHFLLAGLRPCFREAHALPQSDPNKVFVLLQRDACCSMGSLHLAQAACVCVHRAYLRTCAFLSFFHGGIGRRNWISGNSKVTSIPREGPLVNEGGHQGARLKLDKQL
jgi:hypothetical protein